jgi:hypothetical protein
MPGNSTIFDLLRMMILLGNQVYRIQVLIAIWRARR